jgi:hypothetical protein
MVIAAYFFEHIPNLSCRSEFHCQDDTSIGSSSLRCILILHCHLCPDYSEINFKSSDEARKTLNITKAFLLFRTEIPQSVIAIFVRQITDKSVIRIR